MPAPKTPEPSSSKTQTQPKVTDRKPWKKKTPVEVFLDQEAKLREDVKDLEEELKSKKNQLQKFEQARKLFEAS
jgi:hypothetical protein